MLSLIYPKKVCFNYWLILFMFELAINSCHALFVISEINKMNIVSFRIIKYFLILVFTWIFLCNI